MFKIRTGYYLELLTHETMKLFGSTKNRVNKDKNGKNMPQLGITEKVLIHSNIVNNDYQQDSSIQLFLINNLVSCQIFHRKILLKLLI